MKKHKEKQKIYCPNCGSSRTHRKKEGKQRIGCYCNYCSYHWTIIKQDKELLDGDTYEMEGFKLIVLETTGAKLSWLEEISRLRGVGTEDIVREAVDFYLDNV